MQGQRASSAVHPGVHAAPQMDFVAVRPSFVVLDGTLIFLLSKVGFQS